MVEFEPMTQLLDPEWTVFRRYTCGHVQHACCIPHMDATCPICEENS